jgi:hypothetical protein
MPAATVDLLDLLKSVKIDGHQRYEALEIFHLRWASDTKRLDYLTLDEALEAKCIEVAELSQNGQVPQIKIINRSDRMVFLMAGEQVVGCKQNRVLNASMMVPAHREMPLPVTCVEGGRWGYKSSFFSSGHSSSHHHLRAMMDRQATQGYKFVGAPRSDQAAVWGEVSRKLDAMGSRSPSSELQAMYRDHDRKLAQAIEQLPAPKDCHGVVFTIAGKISGADLFDQPETLRKLWPKLVRSCAVDSFEGSKKNYGSIATEEVAAWLERASRATPTEFASPGVGQDIRLEGQDIDGQDIFGAGLVVQDQPVHVELFRSVGENRARSGSRPGTRPVAASPARQPDPVQSAGRAEAPAANQRGRSGTWLNRIFRRKPVT